MRIPLSRRSGRAAATWCLAGLACWLASPSRAYETDQLTARQVPLADSTPAANAEADALLDAAADAANRATRCEADDETTRRVLAREVFLKTSAVRHVDRRGTLGGLGFGEYGAWMETADAVDRRTFPDRSDVYGHLRPEDSLILGTVGTCATVRLAGVLLGTDKLDHFWALGYRYYVKSRFGANAQAAIDYGTRTELTIFGLMTSNAFSFADLRANYDGYQFYAGLLRPGSVMRRGDDGCVRRVKGFDWGDYVDGEYDEVLDPPVLGPRAQAGVTERLATRRDEYCAAFREWGAGYLDALSKTLSARPPYAGPASPPRTDPWHLAELCDVPEDDPVVVAGADQAASALGSSPSPNTAR